MMQGSTCETGRRLRDLTYRTDIMGCDHSSQEPRHSVVKLPVYRHCTVQMELLRCDEVSVLVIVCCDLGHN